MKLAAYCALAAGLLLSSFTLTAEARGGAGGAPGGHFGGMSSSHLSDRGITNSNGPNAIYRGKGAERADSRRSAKSLAHSKRMSHAKRKRGSVPIHEAPALPHPERDPLALPRPGGLPLPGSPNLPSPPTPRLP